MKKYPLRLSPEKVKEIMKQLPPPDCYIVQGKGPEKSDAEIEEWYNKTKTRAEKISAGDEKKELDISGEAFISYKENYIANKLQEITEAGIGKDGKMAIVMGLAGAGKTTTINALKQRLHAFHANMDKIKEDFARDHGVSINHPQVHAAGKAIFKELVATLQAKKINFIQEKVGDEIGKMEDLILDAKNQGYEVTLNLVHISNNTSRQRNISRCESFINDNEAPRMVPDSEVVKFGNGPMETYLALTQEHPEWFKECRCFTTERERNADNSCKEPVEIKGLTYINGKKVVSREYLEIGKTVKNNVKKRITQLVLNTLKAQNDSALSSIEKLNNFDNKVLSVRERKIIEMIELMTEETLVNIFTIYNNDSLIENQKLYDTKFNFDVEKLDKNATTFIEKNYPSKKIIANINKIDKQIQKEQDMEVVSKSHAGFFHSTQRVQVCYSKGEMQ